MDARTQLAIMSKAASVFGDDRTFLSFPVTPLAFSPGELVLTAPPGGSAAQAAQALDRLVTFSELVNRLPDGAAWEPAAAGYVWDAYAEVLAGEFAASSRSPEEDAAYRRACAVCFDEDADGVRTPTPAATAYRAYRDAYRVRVDEHRALALSLQAAEPGADAARLSALEQAAAERVAQALTSWEQQGAKAPIEQAEAEVRRLGARSPVLSWQGWQARFDPDTATLTRATDLFRVYPTMFSPDNALAEGSWRRIEVTGPEIAQAAESAPAELQDRLGGNGTSDLESVVFEFSCATLVRPWLAAEAFEARFWRLPDGALLSDGGTPPQGSCPALAVAVVFLRGVVERRRHSGPLIEPGPLTFDISTAQAVFQHRSPTVLRTRAVATPFTAPVATPAVTYRHAKASSYQRLAGLQLFAAEVASPTAPPTSAPTSADDRIHVCAFLCRPLPRCPDPDPSLTW